MTKQEKEAGFEPFLAYFTAENILSEAAFYATFNASDAFELETRIYKHKQAALKLGIQEKDYDRFLKSYKAMRKDKNPISGPRWLTSDGIDEPAFLDEFNSCRGYSCINGRLYQASRGFVQDDEVAAEIQRDLEEHIDKQLRRKSLDLLGALKNRCFVAPPPAEPEKVYFNGGYYDLANNIYHPDIDTFTFYRLPVDFRPDAPKPEKWLAYLAALLDADDIATFQEFCGYAMVPTTKAQKMLFIIGSGGEGKSVAGSVLMAAFGRTATTGKLHDIETRFGLAGLEGKLLFIDDDLPTAALKETANVKKVVTTAVPVSLERKGRDAYQAQLYCRLLCFGNQMADSLYDHSNGAYRRRLILTTKAKDPNRVDNPNLADEIIKEELPGVAVWMLEGLKRLRSNRWQFTTSEKQRQQAQQYKKDAFNLVSFLEDKDWITFNPAASVTSKELYAAYRQWCDVNGEDALALRTVTGYLKGNARVLKINITKHIANPDGIEARGFAGMTVKKYIPIVN